MLTALIAAASFGHRDIVELLIAQGAVVDAKTSRGQTPLRIVVEKGNKDLADLLKKHGAKE